MNWENMKVFRTGTSFTNSWLQIFYILLTSCLEHFGKFSGEHWWWSTIWGKFASLTFTILLKQDPIRDVILEIFKRFQNSY